MLLTRSHCSLVIAHFECPCSLTSWSHSVHILEINCCRGFRTCDQSSLWTTNSVSCTFTVELTDTSISWVMLSLLTIYHLFSLPRFLPQFLEVRALGKGYLRGTNQAILYNFILLWFGFHTLESESHQWVLIRKKMLKIIKKRDSLIEGEPPHLLNKYPVIPSGLTFHCIVELLLMEVQPSDHY